MMRLKKTGLLIGVTAVAMIVTSLYLKQHPKTSGKVVEMEPLRLANIDTGKRDLPSIGRRRDSQPDSLSERNRHSPNANNPPSQDERTTNSNRSPNNTESHILSKESNTSKMEDFPPPDFEISDSFTLPMPNVTLPVSQLLQQKWVQDLKKYLRNIPPHTTTSSLVTIVSCDLNFKGLLLNWLSWALLTLEPPLSPHVLLLTLDLPLHQLMTRHRFHSLYAQGSELVHSSRLHYMQSHSRTPKLPLVMVWRLTTMRLLNHWGYDTANYDTDAILLRNTEQLFYQQLSTSHFIGSRANFPDRTAKMYGLTMCGGLFMVKSSPLSEYYWEQVSQVSNSGTNAYDDQIRANMGLVGMNLQFNHTGLYDTQNWQGRSAEGFAVTILPFSVVCRWTCKQEHKDQYYVWHYRHDLGNKDLAVHEIQTLRSDGVWALRDDWAQLAEHSTAQGLDWLREMKR